MSIVTNVTAAPVLDTHEVKRLLVEQVTGVVRWRKVGRLHGRSWSGHAEIGAGRVLTGLAKRIRSEADARSVGNPGDVAAFGDWLKARMEALA